MLSEGVHLTFGDKVLFRFMLKIDVIAHLTSDKLDHLEGNVFRGILVHWNRNHRPDAYIPSVPSQLPRLVPELQTSPLESSLRSKNFFVILV